MALVGGDVQAIHEGGRVLSQAAKDLEHRRAGAAQLRRQAMRGAGTSPVAEVAQRLATALDAYLADASREVAALGTLASSTAEDLALATTVGALRDLFRRLP